MMHRLRVHTVSTYPTLEEIAENLTKQTWTCCTAMRFENLLFLNDATSENGAQEYTVVIEEDGRFYEVESFTASWMTPQEFTEAARRTLEATPYKTEVSLRLETREQHAARYCTHCA